jgi:hypothetical protein
VIDLANSPSFEDKAVRTPPKGPAPGQPIGPRVNRLADLSSLRHPSGGGPWASAMPDQPGQAISPSPHPQRARRSARRGRSGSSDGVWRTCGGPAVLEEQRGFVGQHDQWPRVTDRRHAADGKTCREERTAPTIMMPSSGSRPPTCAGAPVALQGINRVAEPTFLHCLTGGARRLDHIWRGFASSIRTWQYRSANSTRLRRPADRESNLRAALPARGAYPSPLRRGHSPTTRLRSRNVIRTGKRHPLVERWSLQKETRASMALTGQKPFMETFLHAFTKFAKGVEEFHTKWGAMKRRAAQSLNVEEVDDPQLFFLVRQLAFKCAHFP